MKYCIIYFALPASPLALNAFLLEFDLTVRGALVGTQTTYPNELPLLRFWLNLWTQTGP